MKSLYKENMFSDNVFSKIKDFTLASLENSKGVKYSDGFGRHYKIVVLPEDIKSDILKGVRDSLNDQDLEVAYVQAIKYQIQGESRPKLVGHKDTDLGTYTLDLVIEGTVNWPLFVEGQGFDSFPNSAVLLKGDEEYHERKEFPSENESDYLVLLFVHFAPKDSELVSITNSIFSLGQEDLDEFLQAVTPLYKKM
jgi:hypothetical protein